MTVQGPGGRRRDWLWREFGRSPLDENPAAINRIFFGTGRRGGTSGPRVHVGQAKHLRGLEQRLIGIEPRVERLETHVNQLERDVASLLRRRQRAAPRSG